MLLVIDVGNTNIVLGVFDGDVLKRSWRISTQRERTEDEYAVICRSLFEVSDIHVRDFDSAAICSVVPPLDNCFLALTEREFGIPAYFVDPCQQSLMPVRYHPAEDVGADRIVNAVAAFQLFGGPAVIVDFGTATTFDVVSAEGEYSGGIIAPGIGISAEALFARAARLPRVDICRPSRAVGQSTVSSIQAGLYFGYVGLVEGILNRIKEEFPGASVTATGGLAKLISRDYDGFDRIEENLTLLGLRIFHRSYGGNRSLHG
jgi:type III pantothenate kinase